MAAFSLPGSLVLSHLKREKDFGSWPPGTLAGQESCASRWSGYGVPRRKEGETAFEALQVL